MGSHENRRAPQRPDYTARDDSVSGRTALLTAAFQRRKTRESPPRGLRACCSEPPQSVRRSPPSDRDSQSSCRTCSRAGFRRRAKQIGRALQYAHGFRGVSHRPDVCAGTRRAVDYVRRGNTTSVPRTRRVIRCRPRTTQCHPPRSSWPVVRASPTAGRERESNGRRARRTRRPSFSTSATPRTARDDRRSSGWLSASRPLPAGAPARSGRGHPDPCTPARRVR